MPQQYFIVEHVLQIILSCFSITAILCKQIIYLCYQYIRATLLQELSLSKKKKEKKGVLQRSASFL